MCERISFFSFFLFFFLFPNKQEKNMMHRFMLIELMFKYGYLVLT